VLGPFHHLAVYFQQVGFFQGLETEIIESIVPVIDDGGIQQFGIVMNDRPTSSASRETDLPVLLSWQLYSSSMVPEKLLIVFLCRLLTAMRLASRAIIGMADGEGSGCLGGEVVQLGGGHPVI